MSLVGVPIYSLIVLLSVCVCRDPVTKARQYQTQSPVPTAIAGLHHHAQLLLLSFLPMNMTGIVSPSLKSPGLELPLPLFPLLPLPHHLQ